jgi:hypothetical protein
MSTIRPRKRILLNEQEGRVTATSEKKVGGESLGATQKTMPLKVKKLPADPAYVSIGAGLTENLGNFESLRIDVRVSLPCGESTKAVKSAAKRASTLVQEFIESERKAALGTEGVTSA